MFFPKKKVQEAADQLVVEIKKGVVQLERELADIHQIADLGARYIAFFEFEEKINELQNKTDAHVKRHADKNARKGWFATWAAGGVTSVAGLAICIFTLIDIVALGGFAMFMAGAFTFSFGASIAEGELSQRNLAILNQAIEGYKSSIEDMRTKAIAARADIVRNEFYNLADSPKFKAVCEKFPPVALEFAKRAVDENRIDTFRPVVMKKPSVKPS